jgi:hypothetical protein
VPEPKPRRFEATARPAAALKVEPRPESAQRRSGEPAQPSGLRRPNPQDEALIQRLIEFLKEF